MSLKHVMKDYNKISSAYHQSLDALHYMEGVCSEQMIDPEKISQLNQVIVPIKEAFETWSYFFNIINHSFNHIRDQYQQVSTSYEDAMENLADIKQCYSTQSVTAEQVCAMEMIAEPLEKSFYLWSYFMYRLNLPNKKSKQRKYDKQHQNLLDVLNRSGIEVKMFEAVNQALNQLNVFREEFLND